jgi:hypothetical protein
MAGIIVYPRSGEEYSVTCDDGKKFVFHKLSDENIGGYCTILIHDLSTDMRYRSTGYLEVNGHIFISKLKDDFKSYEEEIQSDNTCYVEVI